MSDGKVVPHNFTATPDELLEFESDLLFRIVDRTTFTVGISRKVWAMAQPTDSGSATVIVFSEEQL